MRRCTTARTSQYGPNEKRQIRWKQSGSESETDPSGWLRRVGILALLDRTPHARDEVVARGLAIPDQADLSGARASAGRGGACRGGQTQKSRSRVFKTRMAGSQCADSAGGHVRECVLTLHWLPRRGSVLVHSRRGVADCALSTSSASSRCVQVPGVSLSLPLSHRETPAIHEGPVVEACATPAPSIDPTKGPSGERADETPSRKTSTVLGLTS